MESFQKDCKVYQKSSLVSKRIKRQCKEYNSKVNHAFKYGYKLDSSVKNENVDYNKADKFNNYLQDLEKTKETILTSISKEVKKARENNNIEYYKLLTMSSQVSLSSADYDFMTNHKNQFIEHPRYIKYQKEQLEKEAILLKKEQERQLRTKKREEIRLEKIRISKEKEDLRLKKLQEDMAIFQAEINEKIKQRNVQSKTCKEFIVLHSAERLAKEYGKSVKWLYAVGKKINLWQNPTHKGKGNKVGELRIGSHARILAKSGGDYKVISPLDKSIGWINSIQIERTQYQDIKTNIPCTPSAQHIDSVPTEVEKNVLHYSIVKKERQGKGGSVNPPLPPKYVLLVASVALTNKVVPNEKNVKIVLNKILVDLRNNNKNIDAITAFLYTSKDHITDGRSPFSRIEWWDKNHSLSRKNHNNILNKATYKTDIKIFSLPQKIKNPSGVDISKKKKIYKDKVNSELQAIKDADRRYDVAVQWKQHLAEVERLTDKYAKEICKKYKISEEELQKITIEGVMGNW